jgi:hypothetical protein
MTDDNSLLPGDSLDDLLNRGGGFTQPADQLTWPAGAGLGQFRIVAGGDTPPELTATGRPVALLFFDIISGVEVGYHFLSAGTNGPPAEATFEIGYVTYPIPGDPSSATPADVHFQARFGTQVSNNIEIDDPVSFQSTVDVDNEHYYVNAEQMLMMDSGTQVVAIPAGSSNVFSLGVPFNKSFTNIPTVVANFASASGPLSRWTANAFNATLTTFDILIQKGASADASPGANTSAPVTWIAAEVP